MPDLLAARIEQLPLKEQDSSLLAMNIRSAMAAREADLDILDRALATAAWAHRADTRANRGPMPRTHYIEHPLRVALRLLRWDVRGDAAVIAAILHDVVEDHAVDIARDLAATDPGDEHTARAAALEWISIELSPEIAAHVAQLSNPISAADATAEDKRAAYHAHFRATIAAPVARVVKMSDLIDNACSLRYTRADARMTRKLATKYRPAVQQTLLTLSQMTELREAAKHQARMTLHRGYREIIAITSAEA